MGDPASHPSGHQNCCQSLSEAEAQICKAHGPVSHFPPTTARLNGKSDICIENENFQKTVVSSLAWNPLLKLEVFYNQYKVAYMYVELECKECFGYTQFLKPVLWTTSVSVTQKLVGIAKL